MNHEKLLVLLSIGFVSLLMVHVNTLPASADFVLPNGTSHNGTLGVIPYVIGIQLSKTCQDLVAQGNQTECPSYDKLMKNDNSVQYWSGKFIQVGNHIERQKPHIQNHYQLYNKNTVIIDPDSNAIKYIKMIYIVPPGFTYVLNNFVTRDVTIGNNFTLSQNEFDASTKVYHDRYVSDDCTVATIDYSPFLLNDTIKYLFNGCKDTKFNGTTTTKIPDHAWQWNSPQMTQNHWMSQFKNTTKITSNCIFHKCDYVSPGRKW